MKRINFLLLAGLSCLAIAALQIITLIRYGFLELFGIHLDGCALEYIITTGYIYEIVFIITVLYLLSNLALGVISVGFALKTNVAYYTTAIACGVLFLVIRVPFVFTDILHINAEGIIPYPYVIYATVLFNLIPLVLFILGAVRYRILNKAKAGYSPQHTGPDVQ